MPSDTDRTHPTNAHPTTADPTAADRTAQHVSDRRPVWPVTALVVLLGWCLIAWTVVACAISTAPFFGETASRDRYVESGVVALTALAPVALILALGLLLGSRWGLGFLALPALLLVPLGLSMLDGAGDPQKSGYGRAVRWDDLFSDATRLNWVVTAVLLAVIAAAVWWRHRRQTGIRANP